MTATVWPDATTMMRALLQDAGGPCEPAADMAELAEALRTLLEVGMRRNTRVRLGGGLFDVVVTSSGAQARAAAAYMDEVQGGCGPVVEDTRDGLLYWLVPPGTASRWEPHSHAVCLSAPLTITLPSLDALTPPSAAGPYWFRPSASDRLVPAAPLREALVQFRPEPTPHAAFAGRPGVAS
ncbi:hypothetical protein ACFCWY_08900 [Streptomyces sp. NPDC056362]|uniref:hypothetical protein n=1 Tax=unclassified Streptomyces TaxID=2593676 RepID=UPI0035D87473